MKVETSRTFRLPKMSEREAAGRLISIPGMVEAEATIPISVEGVPRLFAKGFRTGFFDIVELRIANTPITHNARKIYSTDLKREMVFYLLYSLTLTTISPQLARRGARVDYSLSSFRSSRNETTFYYFNQSRIELRDFNFQNLQN